MAWDGVERRKEFREGSYCSQHIEFVGDIAAIKTSLCNIEKGVVGSASFKRTLVGSLIGVFVVVIIQIIGFSFIFGILSGKVNNHDDDIKLMKDQIYDLNYEKGRAAGLLEAK